MSERLPPRIGELTGEAQERLNLRSLETEFGGIRFRSRLEARWAVFFNALKLTWQYEEEGYRLTDSLCYLPDFWFPKLGFFIEIKPTEPSVSECKKASLLAQSTHRMVYLFGEPFGPRQSKTLPTATAFFPDGSEDYSYRWCECVQCGLVGIEFEGRADRLACKEPLKRAYRRKDRGTYRKPSSRRGRLCRRTGPNCDKGYAYNTPSLLKAYDAARAERFVR